MRGEGDRWNEGGTEIFRCAKALYVVRTKRFIVCSKRCGGTYEAIHVGRSAIGSTFCFVRSGTFNILRGFTLCKAVHLCGAVHLAKRCILRIGTSCKALHLAKRYIIAKRCIERSRTICSSFGRYGFVRA